MKMIMFAIALSITCNTAFAETSKQELISRCQMVASASASELFEARIQGVTKSYLKQQIDLLAEAAPLEAEMIKAMYDAAYSATRDPESIGVAMERACIKFVTKNEARFKQADKQRKVSEAKRQAEEKVSEAKRQAEEDEKYKKWFDALPEDEKEQIRQDEVEEKAREKENEEYRKKENR